MEQHTPLDPLDEIVLCLPAEQQGPPLRTRALVQTFKNHWDRAVLDLNAAIRIALDLEQLHKPNRQQLELASKMREEQEAWHKGHRDPRSIPQLKEEDQPSSLKMQLLFNRASLYLTVAAHWTHAALDGWKEYQAAQEKGEISEAMEKEQAERLDARKTVKAFARRALKDYIAFLAHFDYTPGLPLEIQNEIMRQVYDLTNGHKPLPLLPKNRVMENSGNGKGAEGDIRENGSSPSTSAVIKHQKSKTEPSERGENGWPRFPPPQIYRVHELFADKPPSDLPPFPSAELTQAIQNNEPLHEAFGSREVVTYHPLLTDALHSLLLAHTLIQTNPTELLRHAHNVARLARIADGYPIFLAARSPARADWIEVLRRANNWLGLSVSWQKLCDPAPLPEATGIWARDNPPGSTSGRAVPRKDETVQEKRERVKQESIIEALSDDRVVDEESFQKAVRARERRAMEDEQGLSGPLKDKEGELPTAANTEPYSFPRRWAQDENGKEYPITTVRAEAIARWIKDAPPPIGGKKKRPNRKKKPGAEASAVEGAQDMANSKDSIDRDEEDGLD